MIRLSRRLCVIVISNVIAMPSKLSTGMNHVDENKLEDDHSVSEAGLCTVMTARQDPSVVLSPFSRRSSVQQASRPSDKTHISSPSPSPPEQTVHNITRKVIRTLEGLGHLDIPDMPQDEAEELEVDESLAPSGYATPSRPESPAALSNGSASPLAHLSPSTHKKIDWEISR
jgi:hypothetical protein